MMVRCVNPATAETRWEGEGEGEGEEEGVWLDRIG